MFQRYKNNRKVPTGHCTSQCLQGNEHFLNPRTEKPNLNSQRLNWTLATSLSRPSVRRSILLGSCYNVSFFVNNERSKYVSIGYYPAGDYQVLVEFGGPRAKPITHMEQHMSTMADYLPALCQVMCNKEHYSCRTMYSDYLQLQVI